MFDIPPDPIAFQLGPITVGWYGLCYAIGLAAAYVVLIRLARAAGEDPDIVGNGIIIVSIAALIGGRLYHVIDQWALYANDPLKIILPPYSGLGVFGGIVTGTLAAWWYARRRGVSFARWADIIAPALFVMQAIGRWGNYFNQELYGPPTTPPWGIPIDCAHRLAIYACDTLPETTRFHPLFLYESISGLLGAAFLVFLGYRLRSWLRPGDLLLIFFIWYGVTRFALENAARGQLDVLRRADRADRLAGVHRDRGRGDGPATSREPDGRQAADGSAARDVGRARRRVDDPSDRRAVGERRRPDRRRGGRRSADETADDGPDDIDTDAADEPEPSVDGDTAAPDETGPRPSP